MRFVKTIQNVQTLARETFLNISRDTACQEASSQKKVSRYTIRNMPRQERTSKRLSGSTQSPHGGKVEKKTTKERTTTPQKGLDKLGRKKSVKYVRGFLFSLTVAFFLGSFLVVLEPLGV